jgi:hypothetical protein
MDTFVERSEIEVLRVRADMNGKGPSEAMRTLEGALPTIKGRRFYGAFRLLPEGEEYFACVERIPADDPGAYGLDRGRIPGGLFARRKLEDWEQLIAEGGLEREFRQMLGTYRVDSSRPHVEFYRSRTELHLLVPVLDRSPTMAPDSRGSTGGSSGRRPSGDGANPPPSAPPVRPSERPGALGYLSAQRCAERDRGVPSSVDHRERDRGPVCRLAVP